MLQTCFKDKEDLVSGVLGLNKFRGQALNVDFAEVFSAFYVNDFLELKFYDQQNSYKKIYLVYNLEKNGGLLMDKYVCSVCGWEYDPQTGDPANDVAAGTAFEDLPQDWLCPICGVGKDQFEKA